MTPWARVATGLFLGDVGRPFRDEFDYVLTLAPGPTPTDEGLRHRHLSLPGRRREVHPFLDVAGDWLRQHWITEKALLVQSPGCSWAELVIADTFVHLGATRDEALEALRRARPEALSAQPFLDLLRAREVIV